MLTSSTPSMFRRFGASLMCAVLATACGSSEPMSQTREDEAAPEMRDGVDERGAFFISREGSKLMTHGHAFKFIGGNHYVLAGGPRAGQCAAPGPRDAAHHAAYVDSLMKEAAATGINMMRMWAFQNFAGPSGRDYSNFDTVVAAANRHHVRLIMTLENHWQDCSFPAGPKQPDWYRDGYKKPYGSYALSLPDYARGLVAHFKNEGIIAAWQLINEGECTDAPAFQGFAHDLARGIKSVDGHHLISVGTLACRQWGTDPTNYRILHDSPDIDLLEAHDYNDDHTPLPACIAADMKVAADLNKPFFLGEVGISGTAYSAAQRSALFKQKMAAQAQHGAAGFLIWSFGAGGSNDGFAFSSKDPVANLVHQTGKNLFPRVPTRARTAKTQLLAEAD